MEDRSKIAIQAVQMRESGETYKSIVRKLGLSTTTARRYACGKAPEKSTIRVADYIDRSDRRDAVRGGITRAQIEQIRKTTYIGSWLVIKTCKGAEKMSFGNGLAGVTRKARVVNTNYRDFCVVELENGVQESVPWTEVMRCVRM